MTPGEIETAAREQYNAVNDTFWSSAEIMNLIFQATSEMANKTWCIKSTETQSSVAPKR